MRNIIRNALQYGLDWRTHLGGRGWTEEAITLNDEDYASNDRESQLIEHFKSHPMGPVELVFEGEYPEGAL